MKMTIEIEDMESYKLGFKHGLEEGVDTNPYEMDTDRYLYRRGYDAGITEYCRREHPEDKKQ